MIRSLVLPRPLADQITREAAAAYPAECCGLIEGRIEEAAQGSVARALACHPTRNLAQNPDRFEIDPAVHIALLRALRGTDRRLIGCYHSHPNGHPKPSATDLGGATEDGFIWLIAGATAMAAFRHDKGIFHSLHLA